MYDSAGLTGEELWESGKVPPNAPGNPVRTKSAHSKWEGLSMQKRGVCEGRAMTGLVTLES